MAPKHKTLARCNKTWLTSLVVITLLGILAMEMSTAAEANILRAVAS